MQTLTGKKRYRLHKQFFKPTLLVLQFEVEISGIMDCCGGMIEEMPPHTTWVDATFELLQEIGLKRVQNGKA